MDFVNQTQVAAGWTLGFAPDGRELLVVAVKATFGIPQNGQQPELAEEQVKLTGADEFTGEPGRSAPLYETDYAHRKPRCDVLVNGSAYAPNGRKVREVPVGLRVGPMTKTFLVTGQRFWLKGIVGVSASETQLFDVMPISYNNAFGGVDDSHADPVKVKTFLENPVGLGYFHYTDKIDGKPLPNTEEINAPISNPRHTYRPMSLGAIGRNWQPRAKFAGTYDEHWREERAPFWPHDFDYQYFQAAPRDQQIPYPAGGEEIVLRNLTPSGHLNFTVPRMVVPALFIPHRGPDRKVDAVVDTIVIEPDRGRFTLTWRTTMPLQRDCFELKQVIVGEMPLAWHRARRFGRKPYYHGLGELIRARNAHRPQTIRLQGSR